MTDTTPIRSTIASCRACPHLDARRFGRYDQLRLHHARLDRRNVLEAARASLAMEVTRLSATSSQPAR
jgi:hypothetical protein